MIEIGTAAAVADMGPAVLQAHLHVWDILKRKKYKPYSRLPSLLISSAFLHIDTSTAQRISVAFL